MVAAHSGSCQCFRYLVEKIFSYLEKNKPENKTQSIFVQSFFVFVCLFIYNQLYTILCREQKQIESSNSIYFHYILQSCLGG